MSGKSHLAEQGFPGQQEGEVVQMLFRQHPLVMRKALFVGLGLLVLGLLPLDFPQIYDHEGWPGFFLKAALVIALVVVLTWIYRWIGWYYTVYIVTDRRIVEIKQNGLFDRRVEEWQLDGINNLNYHVGGFQAVLFGFGDLTAKTYVGDLEMKTIYKPAEVHSRLMALVVKAGGGTGSTRQLD